MPYQYSQNHIDANSREHTLVPFCRVSIGRVSTLVIFCSLLLFFLLPDKSETQFAYERLGVYIYIVKEVIYHRVYMLFVDQNKYSWLSED